MRATLIRCFDVGLNEDKTYLFHEVLLEKLTGFQLVRKFSAL